MAVSTQRETKAGPFEFSTGSLSLGAQAIGLRSNVLAGPASALITFVIEVYRKRKDSPKAKWHCHTLCPHWPEIDYIQQRFLTPDEREHLCPECKRLNAEMFPPSSR